MPVSSKPVRLGVNLNRVTADALRSYAQRRGITMTEAVRRVISLAHHLDNETAAGKSVVLVDKKNGQRREIEFL